MKCLTRLHNIKLLLLGVTASVGLAIAHQTPASAQAAYGSYVGVGPAFGITEGDRSGQGRELSGVIAGRYKFLRSPVSLRAQAFIGDGFAIVPTVSYDYSLNWQTDIYLGVGASIPLGGNTPVGDRASFAIQPGIDYSLPNSKMVIFGNAVISFDGYKGGGTAASLQGGVGLRY
jgi:hypothetical protein